MTRKNRRDPQNSEHDAIYEDPGSWTRASRRSVGYRKPVRLLPKGVEAPQDDSIRVPRYVRRNIQAFQAGAAHTRRNRRRIARIARNIKGTWGTDAMLAGGL